MRCAARPAARAAMAGVNAAVVGLLASALYNPVWTSAVLAGRFRRRRRGIRRARRLARPPLVVVLLTAAAGVALGGLGELAERSTDRDDGLFVPSSRLRKRLPSCANFGTLAADDLMIDRRKSCPRGFIVNPSGRKPVRE